MSKEQNTPGIERRRFRPYPQYKDSGVEWLGKIPAHWDIARIKEQFCIVNGSTPSSSDPSFWDGDIVWVTPDDLGELHVSRLGDSRRKITEEGYKSCGTSIVPKGSIVVSTRAPIGYVAIATTNLCTNQGCKSLVPKRPLSTGFFYYQLSSAKNELESRGEGSTFKEISKDKLGLIILTKPLESDQHSIAFFLDRETTKIDALIEKKERLIGLLQEKRTALITQAVTKGLDPAVPMKDSGVEWLGKIPAHWDISRIKEQFCIVNGSTPSSSDPSFWDGDIVWVTPDDLGELRVSILGDSRRKITEEGYRSCGTSIVPKGSIVVSTRAPIGYVAIATTNLCTNQGCKSLVSKKPLSTTFFYYQLNSAKLVLESRGEGSTFTELSQDKLGLIILTKPPAPDQHSIASFLDRETAKIDALVEKIQKAITSLREYRTALISAAVTGKIDVREA